ncbi:MAG TPA: arylsulfotransferase family protein [Solirubrobacteraceae bacterium]|jgi:hypothetical protein
MAVASAGTLALASFGGQYVLAHRTNRVSASKPGIPRCVPTKLNGSALLTGTTLTVSPLPGSYDASPRTQISLLGAAPSAISGITVSGTQTGEHDGHLKAYSQGDGASFLPSTPFAPGETVTVTGTQQRAGVPAHFTFQFTVSFSDELPYSAPSAKPKANPGEVVSFHSQPGVLAPAISVVDSSGQQAAGYIFAAPYSGPSADGPIIFDDTGNLVWFHPMPSGTEAANLQVQSYEGKPVLSWWQGYIPPQGFGEGEEIVADSSYRTLLRIHAGNGYRADLHDFHLSGDHTALLTVFNPVRCSLAPVGGTPHGAVTDGVFQEIDVKTGLVRREWHSVDHVGLSQSLASGKSSSDAWPFDYFHINTIERRRDGSFLISARNTSALYFIDPASGQISLQIGGTHSDVELGAGSSTAYQHDAQELPNGEISIFDNGGVPMVHSQSRGIVIAVDPNHKTDTLIEQYEHPQPLKAASQGNLQLLGNGDYFLGWGAEPYFSEFTPAGAMVFDARLPGLTESYRGYRFQWSAAPAYRPAIAVAAASSGVDVYASWNGATNVARWRVLGGAGPQQLSPLAEAARGGFETTIALSSRPAYVAVEALDAAGRVLSTSRAVRG